MARPTKQQDGWRVRYVDEYGKQRHGGVYPSLKEAQFRQKQLETQAEEIRRGIREGRPIDRTFSQLCDYYLQTLTPQKRRPRDDKTLIEGHLRPFFGPTRLAELEGRIEEYKLTKRHLSAKTVHKHLTLLGTMCRVAFRQPLRWITRLPEIRKPKIRLFEKDFRYLRNEDEIARFLISAREEAPNVYALYATAIYTGMRPVELSALEWSDVDFEARLICVQRGRDGLTKSRDARYVPILTPLLPLLREWRLRSTGSLVFPSEKGTMLEESGRIFQEVFQRVIDRAGFAMVERRGTLRRYIVFYDLRHTFASHWMMKGGDIFKLSKILGHKTIQMTMRYAHLAPEAYKEDHDRFGNTAPGSVACEVISLAKTAPPKSV